MSSKLSQQPEEGVAVELTGIVDSVRVVNAQSGWGFGALYVKNGFEPRIAFVGDTLDAYIGAKATVAGTWSRHAKFGWQVKASSVQVELGNTVDGVAAWLAFRVPDVGPIIASRLCSAFGADNLWDVIEKTPERLLEVQGVGEHIAHQIEEAYTIYRHEREQFAELSRYGLKPAQIREVILRWGADAAQKVADNPYVLMNIKHFGFKTADTIGKRMNIKRADPRRIVAGLVQAALLSEHQGNTCASDKRLCSLAAGADVLALPPKLVIPWVAQAVKDGELMPNRKGELYRPATYRAELAIADCIRRLLDPEKANQ